MKDVTRTDGSKQLMGAAVVLAVICAVLYFAGSFSSVADHASLAAEAASESYMTSRDYVAGWFSGDAETGDVVSDAGDVVESTSKKVIRK